MFVAASLLIFVFLVPFVLLTLFYLLLFFLCFLACSLSVERYGPVKKISIVADVKTGKPRGYAFVQFEHKDDVKGQLSDFTHSLCSHFRLPFPLSLSPISFMTSFLLLLFAQRPIKVQMVGRSMVVVSWLMWSEAERFLVGFLVDLAEVLDQRESEPKSRQRKMLDGMWYEKESYVSNGSVCSRLVFIRDVCLGFSAIVLFVSISRSIPLVFSFLFLSLFFLLLHSERREEGGHSHRDRSRCSRSRHHSRSRSRDHNPHSDSHHYSSSSSRYAHGLRFVGQGQVTLPTSNLGDLEWVVLWWFGWSCERGWE